MSEIKPIETHYAGCRFRSRLEARWAVFFDALGTPWEYEPQGYELDRGRYLPDFWLPDMGIWVEVKGVLGHADLVKLMGAVPQLRQPFDNQVMPQLLVLGSVPRPGSPWTHVRVDLFRDRLLWQHAFFAGPSWFTKAINQPVSFRLDGFEGLGDDATEWFRRYLIAACQEDDLALNPQVDGAYQRARSARFEFGESG